MVPTNYGGNLSEAKQVDRDAKIHRDFRIGSYNNFLLQIANFVSALVYTPNERANSELRYPCSLLFKFLFVIFCLPSVPLHLSLGREG